MAVIIRAVDGHAGIPAGFPILLTDRMVIIEPAFGSCWSSRRCQGGHTRRRRSGLMLSI